MRRSYTANRLTRIPAAAKTTQPVSELGQAVAALTAASPTTLLSHAPSATATAATVTNGTKSCLPTRSN